MSWVVLDANPGIKACFSDLDKVFSLQGKKVTYDPISDLIYYPCSDKQYYVKRYYTSGKGVRGFRVRPRVQAEWENTILFERWQIPTEKIIAYGQEKRYGYFRRGAFISEEIAGAEDLARLAKEQNSLFKDDRRVNYISQQVAKYTRILHDNKFAHNDLKWRNILVDAQDKVYFIDCPTGRFWYGPFLQYRIIKDLACLDKVAKKQLSRSQRLRFYLQYMQKDSLELSDKKQIKKIVSFFKK